MSFRIEGHAAQLTVRIENNPVARGDVLQAMHACRTLSWWSCPSGECVKIGRCDTHQEEGATVLTIAPRAGEALSPTGVEECLRYVLGEAKTAS